MRSGVLAGTLSLCLHLASAGFGQVPLPSTFPVTASLQITSMAPRKVKPARPPAVLWLVPLNDPHPPTFTSHADYVLLQKNKMFSPHLLVVPVGASVAFPNRDPFFHNVFSLFDGKRFDLGLYESGTTRSVTFSREGVSYIFCNIHPEMSAVVLSLRTPLFSVADVHGEFTLPAVSEGDYEVHLWVEGQSPTALQGWIRKVHLSTHSPSLGTFTLSQGSSATTHTNKFDQPYAPESKTSY